MPPTGWASTRRSSSRPAASSSPAPARPTSPSRPATTRTSTSVPVRPTTPIPSIDLADPAMRLGLPTCWDEWFPEVARLYSLGGAEVLCYPTAIGSEPDHPDFDTQPLWQQVIVGNGIANGLFMVVPNRYGTEGLITFYGSSFISDPYGRVLAQAPRDEAAVLVADLDLAQRATGSTCSPSSPPAAPTPTAASSSRSDPSTGATTTRPRSRHSTEVEPVTGARRARWRMPAETAPHETHLDGLAEPGLHARRCHAARSTRHGARGRPSPTRSRSSSRSRWS